MKCLSLAERTAFINEVVNNCFDVVEFRYDETGNVIGIEKEVYNPVFKFPLIQIVYGVYIGGLTFGTEDSFETKYDKCCSFDVLYESEQNAQLRDILLTIDLLIDERKEQKTNESVINEMLTQIVELNLNNQKEQAKQLELTKGMTSEDFKGFIQGISALNEKMESKEVVQALAKEIHKDNLQDHKKPSKKKAPKELDIEYED